MTDLKTADVFTFLDERQKQFGEHLRTKGVNLPSAAVLRNCVYRLSDAAVALDAADAPKPVVDEKALKATFVITTPSRDRYGDVVVPKGCIPHLANYEKNPRVFFSHKSTDLPIGSCRTPSGALALQFFDDKVLGTVYFNEETEESRAVARLVMRKELEASSIGFKPVKATVLEENDERPAKDEDGNKVVYFDGWSPLRFSEIDLLEWSIVPIPANQDAIACHLSRGHIEDVKVTAAVRKMLEPYSAPSRILVTSGFDNVAAALDKVEEGNKKFEGFRENLFVEKGDQVRWNRKFSSKFDITDEDLKPSTVRYALVSKFLGCPVKEIHESYEYIPSARVGSFLFSWREATADATLVDTRNVQSDGTETPPIYEVIQLNSKRSDEFVVDGMLFYHKGEDKFVVNLQPAWGGLYLTSYSKHGKHAVVHETIARSWDLALTTNNFLRGEAFALSGEFLPRTTEGWSDIFVTPTNEKSLTQTLTALNEKKKSFANRGAIFMGPPGTGKTLAGRVIRNEAEATFIWISARDFYRSGAFGGFTYAFDLAKELAPTVLLFEDVDNWIDSYTVDLLKSTMDGIGRSSGVWTILTTNFPEQLPEALIDRPGRFHDVLMFDLPDETARGQMVRRWLPDATAGSPAFTLAVAETAGYSGAYVYELCHFAKTLQEQENKSLDAAVTEAIEKIKSQKELINNRGSRRKGLDALPVTRSLLVSKSFGMRRSVDDVSVVPEVIENECDPATTSIDEIVKCTHECVEHVKTKLEAFVTADLADHAAVHQKLDALLDCCKPKDSEPTKAAPPVTETAEPPVPAAVVEVITSLVDSQKRLSERFFELTGRRI